jgi:hypothetical protein
MLMLYISYYSDLFYWDIHGVDEGYGVVNTGNEGGIGARGGHPGRPEVTIAMVADPEGRTIGLVEEGSQG